MENGKLHRAELDVIRSDFEKLNYQSWNKFLRAFLVTFITFIVPSGIVFVWYEVETDRRIDALEYKEKQVRKDIQKLKEKVKVLEDRGIFLPYNP